MPQAPFPKNRPDDEELNAFVRRAREDRKKVLPLSSEPTLEPKTIARRTWLYGFLLGVTASIIFSLISIVTNILLLPGLPIYRSFLSIVFNVVLATVIITVFSLISLSSIKIQNRVVIAFFVLLGLAIFYWFYREYGNVVAGLMQGIAFSYVFILPILIAVLCLAPFGMLVRWAVHPQIKYFYKPIYYWKRSLPLLAMLIATIFAGTLFVFSTPEQKAIREVDSIVKQSLRARTEAALPKAIQGTTGAIFLHYAKGRYYLSAHHNPIPDRITASGVPYKEDIFVRVEFQNGYWFSCRFFGSGELRWCETDYLPPLPTFSG